MDLFISNSSGLPIYEQLVVQIKNLILGGQLQEGEMLPSLRSLAKDLRISVITTKRAYDDLERAGFIETVAGKGCFVSKRDPELARESQLKRVEDALLKAIEEARYGGIGYEELAEMLQLMYEEKW
ncbi:MAG: GntR family transcriptional regulator [Sphaerochaetaceae bacterium]|jgi:GntR family transcriptional regulator|nr:GntR family transcriptional regulator [Sphaerochaetaceae bacterium]MDX9809293.1 GntR family transcriptional regulator [Sphaerochaetaceae bacterium]NLV85355.1 GntR family transcriptional regulator [Spirochaetales bacterium]